MPVTSAGWERKVQTLPSLQPVILKWTLIRTDSRRRSVAATAVAGDELKAVCFSQEFFVENQWNFLPLKWRLAFEAFTVDDMHAFLQNKQCLQNKRAPLPLSLLCFQRCAKIYKFRNEEELLLEGDKPESDLCFDGQRWVILILADRFEIRNFN